MAAEYRIGQTIEDPRYTGKSFRGKTIETMAFSPNQNWIPPVYHPFSIEDLVAVHLSDYDAGESGELKPSSYFPYQKGSENWLHPRETIHFSLNGVVPDHNLGGTARVILSKEGKKFAYLIPLTAIFRQVISVFTHDTVVLGKITLPDSTVVIKDQNKAKVLETISGLGYQPLDMRGIKELDPAYLSGTNTNVNHCVNFASMIDGQSVDGPYVWDSLNDVIALDHLLMGILSCAAEGAAMIKYPSILREDISKRINFFVERYGRDINRSKAVLRLQNICKMYLDYLSQYEDYERGFDEALKRSKVLSVEDNLKMLTNFIERKNSIARLLVWREIPE